MSKKKFGQYTVLGIVTLIFAGIFSLFASSNPDGLERVAIDAGFMEKETVHWSFAMFPDYQIPGLSDSWLANSIVGILGVLIMFTCLWIIGKCLVKGEKAIG